MSMFQRLHLAAWGVPLLAALVACGDKGDDDTGPVGGGADDSAVDEVIAWEAVLEQDDRGAFLSVWGPSGSDVWIVGGQPETGLVLRGSAAGGFVEEALPAGVPLLNWVHGVSASDLWVGGIQGALLHWDGSAWTDFSQDMEEAIWGVYAVSSDEVYAVGGSSGFGGENAVALRWDGASWSNVALPSELDGLDNIFKVHHDGTNLWMVGKQGAAMVGDGITMTAVATGITADLVTANRPASGGPMVVVGGRGTGTILEAGADSLTVTAKANAGLNGVQVFASGTQAVVVGEGGYSALYNLDDDSVTEQLPLTTDVLHAAWGEAGGTMYAVGGNLFTAGDTYHGTVLAAPAPE